MAVEAAESIMPTGLPEQGVPARGLVDQIAAFVTERDPHATFSAVYPAPDPGTWVLNAYFSPDLAGDLRFHEELAEHEVDVLIEHNVHLATLLLDRDKHSASEA
jgi:hypothetical protein